MITFWIAALAVAALAVGCGGDGDEDSTAVTTSSVSKAQFVKRVNKICNDNKSKMLNGMVAYEKENGGDPEVQLAQDAIQAGSVPVLETQMEEITAIGAPAKDAAKVEAVLAGFSESISGIESKEPASLDELSAALQPVEAPAEAYGLDNCTY